MSVREAQAGEGGGGGGDAAGEAGGKPVKIDLPPPAKFTAYCLPEKGIDPDARPRLYGAKSTNLVQARAAARWRACVLDRACEPACVGVRA